MNSAPSRLDLSILVFHKVMMMIVSFSREEGGMRGWIILGRKVKLPTRIVAVKS